MSLDPARGPEMPAVPQPTLATVAIPSEHGGWAFTLEPVLLGLLVAFSWSGVVLGLVTLLGFMLRTPLKMVAVDHRRRRELPRTVLARKVAAAEASLVVVLLVGLTLGRSLRFLAPLGAAAPLVAVEWWYDIRSRSRRLIPELAGTIGIGSVAAAVGMLGGASPSVAGGLWLVIAARSMAAVIFVRVQLLRAKQQPHKRTVSDLGQLLAVLIVALGAVTGFVPWVGWSAILVMAGVQIWLVRRPPPAIVIVGAQQVVLGLFVVLTAGLAAAAP